MPPTELVVLALPAQEVHDAVLVTSGKVDQPGGQIPKGDGALSQLADRLPGRDRRPAPAPRLRRALPVAPGPRRRQGRSGEDVQELAQAGYVGLGLGDGPEAHRG